MKSLFVKLGLALVCAGYFGTVNVAEAQTYEQAVAERDAAIAELEAALDALEAGDQVDPLDIAELENTAERWTNYVRLHELVAFLEPAYQEVLRGAGSLGSGALRWVGGLFGRGRR